MTHECPTGTHADRPSYVCYSLHGCRCDECRRLKVARNRRDRNSTRVQVTVDAGHYRQILAQGKTFNGWIADRLERTAS